MSFEKCNICREYAFLPHKCPPIYFFKHPSWGDKFEEIRAWDFKDAARKFAKLYNEDGDYTLMDKTEEVIISDGKEEKKFKVSVEQTIDYMVKEMLKEASQ